MAIGLSAVIGRTMLAQQACKIRAVVRRVFSRKIGHWLSGLI
jgi:hypothetical protein